MKFQVWSISGRASTHRQLTIFTFHLSIIIIEQHWFIWIFHFTKWKLFTPFCIQLTAIVVIVTSCVITGNGRSQFAALHTKPWHGNKLAKMSRTSESKCAEKYGNIIKNGKRTSYSFSLIQQFNSQSQSYKIVWRITITLNWRTFLLTFPYDVIN